MEGAFDAMWSGEVDRNWAEEHHSLWAAELDDDRVAEGGGRRRHRHDEPEAVPGQ